jgi:hypothetical protein
MTDAHSELARIRRELDDTTKELDRTSQWRQFWHERLVAISKRRPKDRLVEAALLVIAVMQQHHHDKAASLRRRQKRRRARLSTLQERIGREHCDV